MNANRIKSHGLKDGALFEEKGFGRLFSKFLAVTISAVLVAATLPAPAFADARIEAASSIGLSTQAASKTVYVIASVKTTTSYDLGLLGSASSTTTASYAYNPQGLVASHTNKTGAVSAKTALTYTGDKIKSAKATVAGATSSAVYTYGASGRITKATTVSAAATNGAAAATAGTVTPTYKSGKVTKLVSVDKATANGQSADATTTTTFSYKSGRVSKSVTNGSVTRTFAYDKNGNLSKVGNVKYKNTYKSGRLAKTTYTSSGATVVRTYKYKKAKVPASVAKLVEAQQWAIANENLNFAFGIAATY